MKYKLNKNLNKLFILFVFLFLPYVEVFATLPGAVSIDGANRWGHNGKFSNPKARGAYIVCEGYIGSPLITDEEFVINSYINNCELTPPPNSLKIIDTPENHSMEYAGYPAYPVNSAITDQVYFVCDGFLSSTNWCSLEAHKKAQKISRAIKPRNWELGSSPLVIDNKPAQEAIQERISSLRDKQKNNINNKNNSELSPNIRDFIQETVSLAVREALNKYFNN